MNTIKIITTIIMCLSLLVGFILIDRNKIRQSIAPCSIALLLALASRIAF